MKTQSFLLTALMLLMSSTALPRDLTLTEALDQALSHSYRLKAAAAQTEAFEQTVKAAAAERLPTLSLSASASYRDEVPRLEIPLPTGETFQRDFGFNENYQTDLRLSLPLYTGGRVGGAIALARATRDYYEAMRQADLDQVYLLVRVGYLSLYRADKMVAAAQAALERAEIIQRDVHSLHDAGAADSLDILEARLAVTRAQFALKSARSYRRQSEIELLVLLGWEATEQITLVDEPGRPSMRGFEKVRIDMSKPDLTAAASLVEMSRHTLSLARSDYLPTITAIGGYSWGKPNIDPFHDDFNDYFTVGGSLTWSFNLGGKTVKKASSSRHQLIAAQRRLDRAIEQADREGRIALENLRLTFEQYETAAENYQITSDNYRLATEKHRQGALSSNRLLEIEASLSEAEASLASTRADFYIMQSRYYYETGSSELKEGW